MTLACCGSPARCAKLSGCRNDALFSEAMASLAELRGSGGTAEPEQVDDFPGAFFDLPENGEVGSASE